MQSRREEIARIVDPYAFRADARMDRHDQAYRDKALAKADAILALPDPQPAVEGGSVAGTPDGVSALPRQADNGSATDREGSVSSGGGQ